MLFVSPLGGGWHPRKSEDFDLRPSAHSLPCEGGSIAQMQSRPLATPASEDELIGRPVVDADAVARRAFTDSLTLTRSPSFGWGRVPITEYGAPRRSVEPLAQTRQASSPDGVFQLTLDPAPTWPLARQRREGNAS